MPAFVLLFLLITSFSTVGQVNKVFEPDVLGFTGERLVLKENGLYEFSEWGCLQSTSGSGTYKLKGDTVIITSYEPGKFPFEITQSYDSKQKDKLYIDIEDNWQGIITAVVINDAIKVFELHKGQTNYDLVKSISKPLIAKISIYYNMPDRESKVFKEFYMGSNNVVAIKMDKLDSYFRPITLPDKWLMKGDTIYNYKMGSFLVDTSLSIQLSDMLSD